MNTDQLLHFHERYEELTDLLSQPEVIQDTKKYQSLLKEQAKIAPLSRAHCEVIECSQELAETLELARDQSSDQELRDLAQEESLALRKRLAELEQEVQILLLPKDEAEDKNIILEMRAGTGGDEASLFVADLFRMYRKYADQNKWRTEIISSHPTEMGGFKEISMLMEGPQVYTKMKFESGTHRVQRVPATETQGRIHTSAITVAVLPEAEEVEVDINPADLRIDTYRSQGAGGQHVNTSDSAVRITHLPTNIVVTCQEERSQIKNRAKAMKYLRSKLYEVQHKAQAQAEASMRKDMVGSGDRSERIRTYNFPNGRITDHRIKLTLHKLEEIINSGNLDPFSNALLAHEQSEQLKRIAATNKITG